ncbi:hypothetical protein ELS19_17245 [Halogeometricum borinquense]|uniref:Uncharacterized protein n=1 Tax=Halogeometricum borinquense TaxID=60847 RepID=A0A482SZ07_9EURY|nr:hypothetical protein [Halogeometricum borinquense]RYJ08301.1 hypothetical protein ELS19_17245 [Halogeometricum borinquense]
MTGRKRLLSVLAVVMAVLMMTTPVAAASSTGLDPDSSKTPNLELVGTLHHDSFNMSWDGPTSYEDDQGNLTSFNGTVNTSASNPVTLNALDIDRAAAGEFPSTNDSSIDPSLYTTSSGANSSVTVGSATSNVPALTVNANVSSGETATATFSNVSITSDAEKRVLWLAGQATTLNGSAEIVLTDDDGDTKTVVVNSSMTTGSPNVATGTVNEAFVVQQKLSDLSTGGTGDGTFDSITSHKIVVTDGDVSLELTTFEYESLSKATYGTKKADTDGDDSLEEVTVTEPIGDFSIESLDSMGSAFSEATIYDLRIDYVEQAERVEYEFNDSLAEDYSYDTALDVYYAFSFPQAVDVSLDNARLRDTVALPTSRLLTAEYIEGAGDYEEFADLANSTAWAELATDYENTGDGNSLVIDSSFQSGQNYVAHQTWLANDDDKSDMETDTGGIGGPIGGAADGILGFFQSGIGILVTGVGSYVAWAKGWIQGLFGGIWSKIAG